VNRSKRSFKTIISGNQPVIECYLLKEWFIDLNRCKRFSAMLDLAHAHQISICFLIFHNNHRLRYGLTPGIVKIWESPQQSWGFIDDY